MTYRDNMTDNKRIDTQTTRLVVRLRDMIMKGEFKPGERLVEAVLSDRLEASRTPVRAALMTLEKEGLVERARGGYVVRTYTVREISEAISVHACLEGMAARLLAEQGLTRELDDALQACLDEGDKALQPNEFSMEDIAAYLSANVRFHNLIVEGAGNRALQETLEFLDRFPFASAGGMLPFQAKHTADGDSVMRFAQRQHHMLVEALRKGQGARAAALAEEHRQIALFNLRHATRHADDNQDVIPVLRAAAQGDAN
ncbi:GntR family transcriptional regulator [Pusillimonas sp. NJUB218]|nr:GntR family transcriptional regulator [Pusillimonas sp. NJUB218]